MKLFRLLCFCCAAALFALAARADNPPATGFSNAPNSLVWDAMEKKQGLPGMTNLAYFTFWVTNTSASEKIISAIDAECECTVIDGRTIFPWKIAPGEGGPLNVRVNIRGRFGPFIKTITVHTAEGPQVLTLNLKIPLTPAPSNVSARQRDVIAAKADRQALFRGSCGVCHTSPTIGLTGGALFEKACGICHQAEQSADFVPNLADLKHPADAEHWRKWIAFGKAGTLMPAFAHSEGGILDTNQIESLVEFVLKEFPSPKAAALKRTNTAANESGAARILNPPESK